MADRIIHVNMTDQSVSFEDLPEEWSLAPEFRELWEVLERINKKIEQKGDIPLWLAEMEPSLLKNF